MLMSPGMKRGEEGEAGIRGAGGSRGLMGRTEMPGPSHTGAGTLCWVQRTRKGREEGKKQKPGCLPETGGEGALGVRRPMKKKEDSNNKVTKLQEK